MMTMTMMMVIPLPYEKEDKDIFVPFISEAESKLV